MAKVQVKRADLKPGEVLCQYCTARCCSYFALPMETPTERADFENIRWFMLHGNVTVFVDSGTWYLCVHNKCDYLRPDNMCGIYETRPQICRDYSTDKCEYDNDGVYDQFFETPDQIQEYADAILPPSHPNCPSPAPMHRTPHCHEAPHTIPHHTTPHHTTRHHTVQYHPTPHVTLPYL